MSTHNIQFRREIRKILSRYPLLSGAMMEVNFPYPGMDELLSMYNDSHEAMFHILDDNDSGVEELPFAAYTTLYDSDSMAPLSNQSFQLTYFGNNYDDKNFEDGDGDDEEENDLEYIDDDEDDDYTPNRSCMSKKAKNKFRKFRHLRTVDTLGMFTPPKRTETDGSSDSLTRHYARKDRTPRTIMKMMEKHRESERVRHHTLNESMKAICSRVPGYDPNAKETKVIQMQRIIGYECFLENTITSLCENLGMKRKMLGINTNFITEAMKDKKPEDWFKIDPIEVSMNDEEDSLLDASSFTNKCIRKPKSSSRHYMKYRREKISSPTVDSTTSDNTVHMFPSGAFVARQPSESSQDGSWLSQGFRPIQESQESGIKTDTQTTIGETVFNDTINSLFEQELCSEPDNLKSVTATFMKDDIVPSSTSLDDGNASFDLSSPMRYNSDKVFLHSPRPVGLWHHPVNLYYSDTTEAPGSREMTSVSPEFILETKPKMLEEINMGSSLFTDSSDSNPEIQVGRSTDNVSCFSACVYPHITDGKNKRKRYTPKRAPFNNISNTENDQDYYDDPGFQQVVKVFKHNIGGNSKDGSKPPVIIISTTKDVKSHSQGTQLNHGGLSSSWDQEEGCQTVDYRRTSWMNGFMMFCRLNRSKFISANRGLHSSNIQKIMGETWRTMSAEAQEPYREKARKYSQYVKKSGLRGSVNDRLVPTSTTDDLEFIIAGL